MDVTNLSGKTAVVTGAASGIGRSTALALAGRGADLAICDLDGAGLERVADEIRGLGRKVTARRTDVGDLEAFRAFADEVHGTAEGVDLLVNNAGVGLGGGFLDTTIEDWRWIVDVNLWGVVHGCHLFVPKMVARGRGGHVVIVSSAAGYVASEPLCAYATTKFAVFGLAEALRDELRRHRIGVTAICPGIIDTPITRSARLRGRQADPRARERMVELYRKRRYGPDKVAARIVAAIGRNAAVAPVTPEAWLMYALKRFSPSLVAWLNRKIGERFERDLVRLGIAPRQ